MQQACPGKGAGDIAAPGMDFLDKDSLACPTPALCKSGVSDLAHVRIQLLLLIWIKDMSVQCMVVVLPLWLSRHLHRSLRNHTKIS